MADAKVHLRHNSDEHRTECGREIKPPPLNRTLVAERRNPDAVTCTLSCGGVASALVRERSNARVQALITEHTGQRYHLRMRSDWPLPEGASLTTLGIEPVITGMLAKTIGRPELPATLTVAVAGAIERALKSARATLAARERLDSMGWHGALPQVDPARPYGVVETNLMPWLPGYPGVEEIEALAAADEEAEARLAVARTERETRLAAERAERAARG